MIALVKAYAAELAKQHPVGVVASTDAEMTALLSGPADWILPVGSGYLKSAPSGAERAVIVVDAHHLGGESANRAWLWKSFMRGFNLIAIADGAGASFGPLTDQMPADHDAWVSLMENMGYAHSYADRIDLSVMAPHEELCSTRYCLANPVSAGAEYLIYAPDAGAFTVDLTSAIGQLAAEWLDPATGKQIDVAPVAGGAIQSFVAPFTGDALLHLYPASRQRDFLLFLACIDSGPPVTQSVTEIEDNSLDISHWIFLPKIERLQ